MKRHLLLATAFLVACGSSSAANDSDPTVLGTGADDAGPGTIPGNGGPDELNERFGVFVATNGKDSNDGSRATPFATIGAAVSAASQSSRRVFVCAGTYNEAIVVANGVSIGGGYDCSKAPAWSPAAGRSIVISPSSPALTARHIDKGTRIEGLDITAPDGDGTNASSIALLAEDATALLVANTKLTAGKGADGAPGTEGIQLVPNSSIAGFGLSYAPYTCPPGVTCVLIDGGRARWPGGVGGTTTCAGAAGHDGEAGGQGGTGGVLVHQAPPDEWRANMDHVNQALTTGESRSGLGGTAGTDGASATSIGRMTADGYLPADGTAGKDGAPGHGGSGGNGRPPPLAPLPPGPTSPEDLWRGAQGSGGGAGGCPGLAGTPGGGGGASIAALLLGSPISFEASELVAHDGGAGGAGTLGSDASIGSVAGNTTIAAAKGTAGGSGGRAGVSGSGAGGPSFAVAYTGSSVPKLSQDTKTTIGKGGAGVARATSTDNRPFDARSLSASTGGTAEASHAF